jgi:hypothetical protein
VLDLLYQGVELLASIVVHSKSSDAASSIQPAVVSTKLLPHIPSCRWRHRVVKGPLEGLATCLSLAYIPLLLYCTQLQPLSCTHNTHGRINKMKGLTKALQRYVTQSPPTGTRCWALGVRSPTGHLLMMQDTA